MYRPDAMMRRLEENSLVLLAALMCGPAIAATPMRFERLGRDEGMSHQAVLAIGQDQRGFMWFGTEDGLNRFDGFAFQQPEESAGLANAFVTDVEIDAGGMLWIATDGSGVLTRDAKTGKFSAAWSRDAS